MVVDSVTESKINVCFGVLIFFVLMPNTFKKLCYSYTHITCIELGEISLQFYNGNIQL